MKRVFFILSICILFPLAAYAHGVAYHVLDGAETKGLECRYASGEVMAYAETLVFSPVDDNVEYQNGRTDRSGRFAFIPNAPGLWRVVVTDGMGHRLEARIPVTQEGKPLAAAAREGAAAPGNSVSTGIKAGLGVSLILNLFFALWFLKGGSVSKKRLKTAASTDTGKVER